MDNSYNVINTLAGLLGVVALVAVACAVLIIVGRWKVLKKMGRNGWASLIPVYGDWEMSEGARADRRFSIAIVAVEAALVVCAALLGSDNGLTSVLSLASFVLAWVLDYHVALAFGKGIGWMLGLALLPVVFWPVLGLGESAIVADETRLDV